jgi:hypothetical protein
VTRLLRAGGIQRITVGKSDDVYEQQADRVAARVVSRLQSPASLGEGARATAISGAAPVASIQRQEFPEDEEMLMTRRQVATPVIRRQEFPEDEETLMLRRDHPVPTIQRQEALAEEEFVAARRREPIPTIQRREAAAVPFTTPARSRVAGAPHDTGPDSLAGRLGLTQGGGQALEPGIRAPLETAFGQDFDGVHIHINTEANSLAHQLGAEAFTTGQDIYFRAGRYQPQTEQGRFLLAHELTHVVQQRG